MEKHSVKRIEYDKYGGPETMRLEDFELPAPEAGQVAVKVKFASINPIDWKLRQGNLKILTGKSFPRPMGSDFSGTILAVGAGVIRLKPGDAVFGVSRLKESGGLGEGVITDELFVAKKPDGIFFEQVACLATAGVTAWNGLVDKAGLKADQRVFVNGCTGNVGEATVQVARMLRARVSGSCGAESIRRAQDLGVHPIFDYRSTDLSSIHDRFDVVYDTSGAMPVSAGLRLLQKDGLLLDIHASPVKFLRSFLNRKLKLFFCMPRPEILDGIASAAVEGKIRMTVGETVPLTDAIRLITDLENGRKIHGEGARRNGLTRSELI
jgi:NADPH:quinone reductase-like Zn-dependent oxidoreductase